MWIRRCPLTWFALLAALIFSAKEAFYKAQYELTTQWLDFNDVTLDLAGYTLRYASVSGSGTAIHGKDVQNVEIRNGAIEVAPWDGVSLTATSMSGTDKSSDETVSGTLRLIGAPAVS